MTERWIKEAKKIGFSEAVPLDVHTLTPMKAVRDMCAEDKCRAYGKNWTCPPYCGSLEECGKKMQGYSSGILVQTVGEMQRDIDYKKMVETEKLHMKMFHELCDKVRQVYPDALCLGAGGCRICAACAYPEPCRFPDKACASMEGYGLFVTQVCKDNQVPYYHGARTITYTSCVLFE